MQVELAALGLLPSVEEVIRRRREAAEEFERKLQARRERKGADAEGVAAPIATTPCEGGSMSLFGRCVPKLYVYGGIGAVALAGLLIMRRRAAA